MVSGLTISSKTSSNPNSPISDETLPNYCTTMLLNQKPDGTPSQDEKYFLLSDIISEDLNLRQDLDKRLLKSVVDQHQFELTDKEFTRGCIFCRDVIGPMRSDFIDHLYNKHFLLLGKSEKLVFVDHLFDRIEKQMEGLICLFCEKLFKDRTALKEHMRKKGHKKINPANKSYDQYFLVHYYKERQSTNMKRKTKPANEVPKQPQPPKPRDLLTDDYAPDSDSDWSDWKEESQTVTCLFCPDKQKNFTSLKKHMIEEHNFNLEEVLATRSFYERIKIVNFIRRQMLNHRCIACEKKHEDRTSLQVHLKEENHCEVPESTDRWNQPEYFFPTFEDDALLYFLEEDTNLEHNDSVQIFSEESTVEINKDAENLSRENFQSE